MGNAEHVGDTYVVSNIKVWCPVQGRDGEQIAGAELNRNGAVTRFRGVIERVNARLKRMAYLRNTAPNISVQYLGTAWRVAAYLCNRWFVPLSQDVEVTEDSWFDISSETDSE